MGLQESKSEDSSDQSADEIAATENLPSTPSLTTGSPLDPRSPSLNIARTPLELILAQKTKQISGNSGASPQLVQGIDPRSPTTEFERTPIIIDAIPRLSKLPRKSLDNARKSLLRVALENAEVPSNIVPPKLLESSPISPSSNAHKRRSMVGVLETNIDFTETDLDRVQSKVNLNKSLPDRVSENCVTPLTNKIKSQMNKLSLEPQPCLNLNDDPEETDVTAVEKITPEETINVTAHVKDFDKKLSNLIYEDSGNDEKRDVKVARVRDNNRTPLGVRNGNEAARKSVNKLKVSDKPRKSDGISRIPVFKDVRKGVQCENTPPRQMLARNKAKVSQWDGDKTLVI